MKYTAVIYSYIARCYICRYHIAGKFGRGKLNEFTLLSIWQKKFGKLIDQPKDY